MFARIRFFVSVIAILCPVVLYGQFRPTMDRFFDISSTTATFGAEGGSKVFEISSSGSWKISSGTKSWGHLTKNGNKLTLRVDANTGLSSRTDSFVLTSGDKKIRVSITQTGEGTSASSKNTSRHSSSKNKSSKKTTYLYAKSAEMNFEGKGGTMSNTIYCDGKWDIDWTSMSWATVQKQGNTIVINAEKNSSDYDRSGQISLKSNEKTYRIDVKQPRIVASYFWTSEYNLIVEGYGEEKTITVFCDAPWKVSVASASWVHLDINGDKIKIKVDPSPDNLERTDYFVLKSGEMTRRIDIKQSGEIPYINITKNSIDFERKGGKETIRVSSNANWEVNYYYTSSWIQTSKEGNVLIVKVPQNTNGYTLSGTVTLEAGNCKKTINVTQSTDDSKGFFVAEKKFSPHFINFQGGYNMKSDEFLLGASYSYIKSHLGFRLSGYYGFNESFAATIDPVFRLTNDNSPLDLQLYFGGGIYNDSPIGEAGLRFAWRTGGDFSFWDVSLGCMGTLDEDIIPTVGVGVAIPFSPLLLAGYLLFESSGNSYSNYSNIFLDLMIGYADDKEIKYGLSVACVPERFGWYGSVWVNDFGVVTGPVIRLTSPRNSLDFQLYGGVGFYNREWAYDVGIRLAPTPDNVFSWWDLSVGIMGNGDQNYLTCGASLGISAIVAGVAGFIAAADAANSR